MIRKNHVFWLWIEDDEWRVGFAQVKTVRQKKTLFVMLHWYYTFHFLEINHMFIAYKLHDTFVLFSHSVIKLILIKTLILFFKTQSIWYVLSAIGADIFKIWSSQIVFRCKQTSLSQINHFSNWQNIWTIQLVSAILSSNTNVQINITK